MLAPPPPPAILLNSANSLEVPSPSRSNRVYRSNSCVSDTGAYLVAAQPAHNGARGGRRPSKAYLLKQRSTGEETVVMLTRVGAPVAGARTLMTNVPTFVSSGVPVKAGVFFQHYNLLHVKRRK